MKEKKYFTVGEFAKLFNISKQTLFYYERNGIFAPSFVNDNGYRYYSFEQFYIFEIVAALRAIDVPLKKIAEYVKNRNPESLRLLLIEKQKEYEEQMALIRKNQEHIEKKLGRLSLITAIETGQVNDLFVERVSERTLVVTPYPQHETTPEEGLRSLSAHNEKLRKNHSINENPTGYLLPLAELETGNYLAYSHFFTDVSDPAKEETIITKPAGLYATIYKKSRKHPHYMQAVDALKEFIASHRFRIAGDAYITPIRSFWTTTNPDDYITKISILVEDADG